MFGEEGCKRTDVHDDVSQYLWYWDVLGTGSIIYQYVMVVIAAMVMVTTAKATDTDDNDFSQNDKAGSSNPLSYEDLSDTFALYASLH